MSKEARQPDYIVTHVFEIPGGGKTRFTNVGIAYTKEREDGSTSITLFINEGVAITGKVMLLPPKEAEAKENS